MHKRNIVEGGKRVEEAQKAIILVHGRGGDARGMIELKDYLSLDGFALLAPQATNNSWYPYSFVTPAKMNEPWLSSAIETIHGLIDEILAAGIRPENLYLAGFSQGACLTLESAARKAQRYGGIIAFTGGLIGENIDRSNYKGNFMGTPISISSGNSDPHIPVSRVHESTKILEEMGAVVTETLFKGKQHTIIEEEIEIANSKILNFNHE
jgi:phospholipase/carboxylesterase